MATTSASVAVPGAGRRSTRWGGMSPSRASNSPTLSPGGAGAMAEVMASLWTFVHAATSYHVVTDRSNRLRTKSMRLADKAIIVTGSTTGIGEAMARRFVAEGARVLVHGRDRGRGEKLVAELGRGKAALHVDD